MHDIILSLCTINQSVKSVILKRKLCLICLKKDHVFRNNVNVWKVSENASRHLLVLLLLLGKSRTFKSLSNYCN